MAGAGLLPPGGDSNVHADSSTASAQQRPSPPPELASFLAANPEYEAEHFWIPGFGWEVPEQDGDLGTAYSIAIDGPHQPMLEEEEMEDAEILEGSMVSLDPYEEGLDIAQEVLQGACTGGSPRGVGSGGVVVVDLEDGSPEEDGARGSWREPTVQGGRSRDEKARGRAAVQVLARGSVAQEGGSRSGVKQQHVRQLGGSGMLKQQPCSPVKHQRHCNRFTRQQQGGSAMGRQLKREVRTPPRDVPQQRQLGREDAGSAQKRQRLAPPQPLPRPPPRLPPKLPPKSVLPLPRSSTSYSPPARAAQPPVRISEAVRGDIGLKCLRKVLAFLYAFPKHMAPLTQLAEVAGIKALLYQLHQDEDSHHVSCLLLLIGKFPAFFLVRSAPDPLVQLTSHALEIMEKVCSGEFIVPILPPVKSASTSPARQPAASKAVAAVAQATAPAVVQPTASKAALAVAPPKKRVLARCARPAPATPEEQRSTSPQPGAVSAKTGRVRLVPREASKESLHTAAAGGCGAGERVTLVPNIAFRDAASRQCSSAGPRASLVKRQWLGEEGSEMEEDSQWEEGSEAEEGSVEEEEEPGKYMELRAGGAAKMSLGRRAGYSL